jgi:hypothetical protein
LVEIAFVLPCSETAESYKSQDRRKGTGGNLHSALGGDIKTKQTTSNDGNSRNGVDVPDSVHGGPCLIIRGCASSEAKGAESGLKKGGAVRFMCSKSLRRTDCETDSFPRIAAICSAQSCTYRGSTCTSQLGTPYKTLCPSPANVG